MKFDATINKLLPGAPKTLLQQLRDMPEEDRQEFIESLDWYKRLPDDPKYKCQYCLDKGFNIDEYGRARDCKCRVGLDEGTSKITLTKEYTALDYLLKKYGWENWPLPEIDALTSHDDFVYTKSIQKAQWVIASMVDGGQGTGLILCGASGRGKTLSGLLILRQAALLKKKCFAIRFMEIIKLIRQGHEGNEKKLKIMNMLFDADAALVDELKEPVGGNQQHGKELIEDIIDHFHRNNKTLIITTNFDHHKLKDYITPSTYSRVASKAGWCSVIEEPQGDLRGSKIIKGE